MRTDEFGLRIKEKLTRPKNEKQEGRKKWKEIKNIMQRLPLYECDGDTMKIVSIVRFCSHTSTTVVISTSLRKEQGMTLCF